MYEGTRVTDHVKKPLGFSAVSRILAALGLAAAASLGSAGCSSSEEEPCVDSACPSGQRCVQEECRSSCTSDSTCPGAQVCRAIDFDGTGQSGGNYCVVLPGRKSRWPVFSRPHSAL